YTGTISPSDTDGDGILNGSDNCPAIFNPIRPLDGGVQADADGDGEGDLCDPCPQSADSRTCTPPDVNDVDADGVVNVADNCPDTANPTQVDADSDGKGDACDLCPTRANPGTTVCPSTIYEVRQTVAAGTVVSVEGVVTARRGNSFFIQVPTTASEYTTARFSGLYVYIDPGNPAALTLPAAGRRVRVQGTAADFFGQRQLSSVSSIVELGAGTIPAPVVVTPAAVTTTGADADDYEAVLVRVAAATVTTKTVASGPGDIASNNEYLLNDALRVDDAIYNSYLVVNVGDTVSVTGPLMLSNGNTKILPRSPDDVVGGTGTGVVVWPSCLLISEYVEGSSQNKAVEILNCGAEVAQLTGVRLALQTNANSGNTISDAWDFTGTLAPGDVLVVCGSTNPLSPALEPLCDVRSGVANFNGDDRLLLYGEDNATSGYTPGADLTYDSFGEWGVVPFDVPWANQTYRRCVSTTPHVGGFFDVLAYYLGFPSDTFTGLGLPPATDCP
ncbi:MAG: thrombospondin type 3 repeat-containing protein, partial [Myxococcales bacterium]|nr:thrombospondin type 3 repeat-containing protein [Myxococcales bacterium]